MSVISPQALERLLERSLAPEGAPARDFSLQPRRISTPAQEWVRKLERGVSSVSRAVSGHKELFALRQIVQPRGLLVGEHPLMELLMSEEWRSPCETLLARYEAAVGAAVALPLRREYAELNDLLSGITPLHLATQRHFGELVTLAAPTLGYTGVAKFFTPLSEARDHVCSPSGGIREVQGYMETSEALLSATGWQESDNPWLRRVGERLQERTAETWSSLFSVLMLEEACS